MNRSALRAQLRDVAGPFCEWPGCGEPGVEVAHLHSVGMGGKHTAADELANVAWLCRDHARISDQEYGSGGAKQYREALLALLGDLPTERVGWLVAEAMRTRVQQLRGWAG